MTQATPSALPPTAMPHSVSLRRALAVNSLVTWFAITEVVPLAGVAVARSPASFGALLGTCLVLGSALAFGMHRLTLRRLDRVLLEQRAENLRFHTAIDNISQGLCFFDGSQRLIVCNRRYAEMYRLTLDLVRPGTTLGEIVDHRFNSGCFPDMTPADYLTWQRSISISKKASDTVLTLKDGRTFAIRHEPMPDGGWVATHEDITERRRAVAQIERMAQHDAQQLVAHRVAERVVDVLEAVEVDGKPRRSSRP